MLRYDGVHIRLNLFKFCNVGNSVLRVHVKVSSSETITGNKIIPVKTVSSI